MSAEDMSREALLEHVDDAHEVGDWRGALLGVRELLSRNTVLPASFYATASTVYMRLRESFSAELVARDGVERHPDDPEPAMAYAEAACYLGKDDEAMARWFVLLGKFHGHSAEIYLRAASTFRFCGEEQTAADILQEGLEAFPGRTHLESGI